MSVSSANAPAGSKTRYVETLTSGTSWTVPASVEYVNATLIGGGQGGTGGGSYSGLGSLVGQSNTGNGGQVITTTVTTTPGDSIAYAIGTGGAGGAGGNVAIGSAGGTTTFTGATSATGGDSIGRAGISASNGGAGGFNNGAGSTGGAGQIILEYWK